MSLSLSLPFLVNDRNVRHLRNHLLGSELIVQLVPLVNAALRSIESERPKSTATHELLFQAAKIPALGHRTFYVLKSNARYQTSLSDAHKRQSTKIRQPKADGKIAISNGVRQYHIKSNQ